MTFDEANTARPYLKIRLPAPLLAGVTEQMFCAGCPDRGRCGIYLIDPKPFNLHKLPIGMKSKNVGEKKNESEFYQFRPPSASKLEIRRRRQDDLVRFKKKRNRWIGQCLENSAAQR